MPFAPIVAIWRFLRRAALACGTSWAARGAARDGRLARLQHRSGGGMGLGRRCASEGGAFARARFLAPAFRSGIKHLGDKKSVDRRQGAPLYER